MMPKKPSPVVAYPYHKLELPEGVFTPVVKGLGVVRRDLFSSKETNGSK